MCTVKYRGRDKFEEPLRISSWGIDIKGEIPRARVYDILIGWEDFISGGN